jgi:putative transcriptional regulator
MTHHPPDDLLAAYAAGTADDGEALLVASHLALCPTCRARCDDLDRVGGALLERTTADVAEASLDVVLSRLDEPIPPPPPPMPPAGGPDDLPMPLRGVTGPLAGVRFRHAGPGIWRFELPQSRPGRPVALLSLRPGLRIPDHRHSATERERGLVLRGGFTDDSGHYVRGDVSVHTPDEPDPHRQQIDDGERCVVLMVDDGPKIPTTWFGRLVNFLFGL